MSFTSQIANRNFLSPGGFRFTLGKYPKVAYFAQAANIPGISVGEVQQPTPYRTTFREGMMTYQPFSLRFMVDEDLENYMIMHNWMRGLATPDNYAERQNLDTVEMNRPAAELGNLNYADGTLFVLSSNFQPKFQVYFRDLIPTSLTTLEFDSNLSDTEYFSAQVDFTYVSYQVQNLNGQQINKLK